MHALDKHAHSMAMAAACTEAWQWQQHAHQHGSSQRWWSYVVVDELVAAIVHRWTGQRALGNTAGMLLVNGQGFAEINRGKVQLVGLGQGQ